MRSSRLAVLALVLVTGSLSAQTTPDPFGTWKAVFVGPIGP
jgi:hypothetical protein